MTVSSDRPLTGVVLFNGGAVDLGVAGVGSSDPLPGFRATNFHGVLEVVPSSGQVAATVMRSSPGSPACCPWCRCNDGNFALATAAWPYARC